MNDQPFAEDLLRAVERFLEQDVVPALDGVAKFHARVAANVVAMVAREIETCGDHEAAEWQRLGGLLGDAAALPEALAGRRAALVERNEALCERIRTGAFDTGAERSELLAHLRSTVTDKMSVSKPPRQRAEKR